MPKSSKTKSQKPEYLDLSFEEAIKWFREKISIPTETWDQINAEAREKAFTVAGITRANMLEDARMLVERQLTEGNSFDDFTTQWKKLISSKGWSPKGNENRRIYLVADTNTRKAFSAGVRKQYEESGLQTRMPYKVWRWRDSPNPRINHQALHNKAILANSDFWKVIGDLPCGFGCRCQAFYANAQTIKLLGATILDNPPDPKTIAEEGFGLNLTNSDLIDQAKKTLSPEMAKKL